jgi:hypothetical protein
MSSERRKAGLAAAKARGKTLSAASTRQASRGGPMRLLVLRRCGLCHGDGVEQAIHSDSDRGQVARHAGPSSEGAP